MTSEADNDAEFVVSHAERLVKHAVLCAMYFGLTEGAHRTINEIDDVDSGWHQAAVGFGLSAEMATIVLVSALLDSNREKPDVVSLQAMYHRLKRSDVQDSLIERYREHDEFANALDGIDTRGLIDRFLLTYRQIDFKDTHGRMKDLRDRGLVHILVQKHSSSFHFEELRTFVNQISELSEILQRLCKTKTAANYGTTEEFRRYGQQLLYGKGAPEKPSQDEP